MTKRRLTGTVPERTIVRLGLYRRVLLALENTSTTHLFSHQLAAMARVTAAQVRRDLMPCAYQGSTNKGYEVRALSEALGRFLDLPGIQGVALVGVGNLGRALLTYFQGRRPHLSVVAAFDADPGKAGRVISGVRVSPMEDLPRIVREMKILVGIVAVPATAAQGTADALVAQGVRGLVNFAPVRLWVPGGIFVEDLDMALALEKVAFYARPSTEEEL